MVEFRMIVKVAYFIYNIILSILYLGLRQIIWKLIIGYLPPEKD